MRRPFVLSSVALLSLGGTPDSTDYSLVCRGGEPMELRVHRNLIAVWFKTAATGAEAASPAPGHCAWLDRGFRPGEPSVLLWWTRDGIEVTTLLGRHDALPRPAVPSTPEGVPMHQMTGAAAGEREQLVVNLFTGTERRAGLTRALAQAVAADRERRAAAADAKQAAMARTWVDRLEFEGDDAGRAAAFMYLYRAVERGELFFVSAAQSDDCRYRTLARCLRVARVGP